LALIWLREAAGWSLKEVSTATGLSVTLLSLVSRISAQFR
jgi:transcriptional regulator with XRE-family HTH domain